MRSLRTRVTVAMIAAAGLVFALSGVAVVTFFSRSEHAQLDRQLERDHGEFELWYAEEILTGPRKPKPEFDSYLSPHTVEILEESDQATQVRLGREVLYWSGALKRPLPFVREERATVKDADGNPWRVHTRKGSLGFEWGDPQLQVARSAVELEARVARVRTIVVGVGIAASLLIGFPAWLLTGVALAPLARMRESATGISSTGDLGRRVPNGGPEEVDALATELNGMLTKLERQVGQTEAALEATRTFTADAGHELRTPLTSLRANLDVLSRDDLEPDDRERSVRDALAAHGRLTALIDALQVLARGDSAVGHRPERLDLGELVDAVVMDARRRHPQMTFELEGTAEAVVDGDTDGLRMLLDHLLENAAVHGGRRVRVHVRHGDGFVRLSVDDDGPGIPDVEKGRVFERFARGSGARNGTGSGLGLAIAAQQAELHGGRLKLDDSPLGGARFELTLSAPARS